MSKHTPGPWQIDFGDSGDDSVGMGATPPSIYVEHPDTGEVIILCEPREPCYHVEPVDEYDEGLRWYGDFGQNVRLMAFAPDLFAICQQVEHNLRQEAFCSEDLEKLQEIIAKVNGEQP